MVEERKLNLKTGQFLKRVSDEIILNKMISPTDFGI